MLHRDNATVLLMNDFIEKILKISVLFKTAKDFVHDSKNFDAVLLIFLVLGESVLKLSQKFKEMNYFINWKHIESFQNLDGNDFLGYDENKIWNIIQNELPKLKEDFTRLQYLN
jgi:uncharacterized protein with HEPN domain